MRRRDEDQERADFMAAAMAMYEALREWRAGHAEASFDEIAGQVTKRRRELMGQLLEQLASQHGKGEAIEGVVCQRCGVQMIYKGPAGREVLHLEGTTRLERAYYYCARCESGLFPPG